MSEFDTGPDPGFETELDPEDRPVGGANSSDDEELGSELDLEVPEADAAEQRRSVPIDDEERDSS